MAYGQWNLRGISRLVLSLTDLPLVVVVHMVILGASCVAQYTPLGLVPFQRSVLRHACYSGLCYTIAGRRGVWRALHYLGPPPALPPR